MRGYTRINEKVPCSHPINMCLIKGVGRPEAQILSFYKYLLYLSALAVSPCARWCLKALWEVLSGWLALGWMRAGKEHCAVFHGLSASCHQLRVLKRCCHFIQRDLLGQRENLNTKHAIQKLVKGL